MKQCGYLHAAVTLSQAPLPVDQNVVEWYNTTSAVQVV
jgi:hypothetical protein